MTASFEWAGLASVVVSAAAPVLAALIPACLERRKARGLGKHSHANEPRKSLVSSDAGHGVQVDGAGAREVYVIVRVLTTPAACVICSSAKERAQW